MQTDIKINDYNLSKDIVKWKEKNGNNIYNIKNIKDYKPNWM